MTTAHVLLTFHQFNIHQPEQLIQMLTVSFSCVFKSKSIERLGMFAQLRMRFNSVLIMIATPDHRDTHCNFTDDFKSKRLRLTHQSVHRLCLSVRDRLAATLARHVEIHSFLLHVWAFITPRNEGGHD